MVKLFVWNTGIVDYWKTEFTDTQNFPLFHISLLKYKNQNFHL